MSIYNRYFCLVFSFVTEKRGGFTNVLCMSMLDLWSLQISKLTLGFNGKWKVSKSFRIFIAKIKKMFFSVFG